MSHPRHWPQPWAGGVQTAPCSGTSPGYGSAVDPAAGGGCKPGSGSPHFFPSETEVPSVGQGMGGLSALHSPPWPPFPLGNGELIRPAADLPCLAPAEEEPAKPQPLMSEPRLAAGPCLLQGSWSRGAQRSSGTGCACLQRSRDVRPPRRRTALLLTRGADTRVP